MVGWLIKSINVYSENVSPYDDVLRYTSILYIYIYYLIGSQETEVFTILKELKLKKKRVRGA